MPKPFLKAAMKDAPRTPGIGSTGPVPVKPQRETMPVEELQELQKKEQGTVPGSGQPTLLLPLMMNPAGGQASSRRTPRLLRQALAPAPVAADTSGRW